MFLELTNGTNGAPITINTERIVSIEPTPPGTRLCYDGERCEYVTESYAAVLAAMTPYALVVRAAEVAAIAEGKA